MGDSSGGKNRFRVSGSGLWDFGFGGLELDFGLRDFLFLYIKILAVLLILIYKDKKKKAEREKEQDDR